LFFILININKKNLYFDLNGGINLKNMYYLILGSIFFIFFFMQKIVFTYAERVIFKFIPIIIVFALGAFGYIAYHAERYLLFNGEYPPVTYQIDGLDIIYFLLGILILPAIIGCILGIAYAKVKEKVCTKGNLKHEKVF